MFEMYVDSNGKKLRCGYTTGSCSAGAAKASTIILFNNAETLQDIDIISPNGIKIRMPLSYINKGSLKKQNKKDVYRNWFTPLWRLRSPMICCL